MVNYNGYTRYIQCPCGVDNGTLLCCIVSTDEMITDEINGLGDKIVLLEDVGRKRLIMLQTFFFVFLPESLTTAQVLDV